MKKVLVLACVLVFALGSMANAAYIINGSATNLSGTGFMSDPTFGEWPVTSTAEHSATVNTAAQLSVIDETNAPGQLLFRDLAATAPETWSLMLHTGLDFDGDTVLVKLWSSSGPSWDSYACADCCLTVVDDPMGFYTAGDILWQGAFVGDTAKASPTVELQVHANKTTNPFEEGLKLSLGPCGGPVIPEPGSIMAMFSGLIGLAGFGLRKRS